MWFLEGKMLSTAILINSEIVSFICWQWLDFFHYLSEFCKQYNKSELLSLLSGQVMFLPEKVKSKLTTTYYPEGQVPQKVNVEPCGWSKPTQSTGDGENVLDAHWPYMFLHWHGFEGPGSPWFRSAMNEIFSLQPTIQILLSASAQTKI